MKVNRENRHLDFIDNLKIALIMLVVAHHAGQAYGPGGWWYFQEGVSVRWLSRFFSVNAAFFMSLFFFLSAYFLPRSIERKGPKLFLIERFKRIGIPLLLGFLVMIPILMYLYYINFRGYPSISFFAYYRDFFFGMADKPVDWSGPSWPDMQFGHLWFLEHLLVYAIVLSAWAYFFPQRLMKPTEGMVKWYQVLLFWLGLSLVTFFVRIWYPIDRWSGVLGFIQTEFAHVPQYVSFFVLGIIASRRKWLVTMSARAGYIWLAVGVGLAFVLYVGGEALYPYLLKGGANVGSLTRSFIETLLCISLIIGLLLLFREKVNGSSPFLKTLSANVFVVYFIHVPVVVCLQYLLGDIQLAVMAKFLLTAFFGILLSFLFSHFIWRKIPFLKELM